MEVYTLGEAACKAKIGVQTIKGACEEGLIKASHLPNRQCHIAESALEPAQTREGPQPAAAGAQTRC